jgi:hypothetical protein
MTNNQIDLYGGDPVASNYPTAFGGSKGLGFAWTGPNGFTSNVQNPVTDTTWGTYNLTVTEKRNGCTATASTNVQSSMFTVLLSHSIRLEGVARGTSIALSWQDADQGLDASYIVERSDGGHDFAAIGTVFPSGASGSFGFTDVQPFAGSNLYRIKAISVSGEAYYSPVITVGLGSAASIYLATAGAAGPTLYITTQQAGNGVLVEYDLSGRALEKRMLSFGQGVNSIPVSPAGGASAGQPRVSVFALFMDGRMAWCQKVVF